MLHTTTRSAFALLFLLLPAGLSGQAPGSTDGDATGRIEGRVLSAASEAPLAGASVEVASSDARAVSDARGYFVIRSLPEGTVTIRVQRLGFVHQEVEVTLRSGERAVVNVTLDTRPIGMDPLVVLSHRTRMIGDPLNLAAIPGSAHFLGPQDLEDRKSAFDNVHNVLRRIPGVNVQDEEGYGLRPNIGLRGTGVERSSKITLMEDGVLIAPAPYAAPAAYYFPVVGRMEAVEVRKGSSQVRYGPRTIGGAINLVSASIPDRTSWTMDAQGGTEGQLKLQARGGGSGDHFGWMVETYQIRTDGFKELPTGDDTGFQIADYTAKLRINTDREADRYQELELKLGYHDERSDETYLGLTDADFAANPLLRYPASAADQMNTEHGQIQLRHFVRLTPSLDLTTTAYRNEFARNWYKLGHVTGSSIASVLEDPDANAEAMAILRGANSGDDALTVRANNREYLSEGIQSVGGVSFQAAGARHGVEAGVRLHRDSEDRFQWEDGYLMSGGRPVRTSTGTPGTQTNRVGEAAALSVHVLDEITAGRWTLVPGMRYERIELTRTDYPTDEPSRDAPSRIREKSVTSVVPGLGASFQMNPSLHLFGGVHRGFAPPGPGAAEETRPESSVNYELGARLRNARLGMQVTGFFSDYSNVLGQATLATGETGAGDQFNGGAVRAAGIEASLDYDLAWGLDLPVRLPVSAAYTLTDATFDTGFESDFGPWGTVEAGDHLPYLARHQFSGSLGAEGGEWDVTLVASGASAMRTRAGKGPLVDAQSTDAFLVFDLQAGYDLPAGAGGGRVYAGIQNLADSRYVAARRPAGVRPGLPRTIFLGVRMGR